MNQGETLADVDRAVKGFFMDGCKLTVQSMPSAGKVLRKRLLEHAERYQTRRQMAAEIGVSPETLTRWLADQGVPNPRLSELEEIASALGLTLGELLVDAGEPRPVLRPVAPAVDPRVTRALERLLDGYDEVAKIAKELAVETRSGGKR